MTRIRFAVKNTAHRPKTANGASGAQKFYCSALQAEFFSGVEVNLHPNRVAPREVLG
jgi:hypothetical protein